MLACQLLQRFQHVGHDEASVVDFVLGVADDTQRGALLEGFGGESVAVEMFAFESEENTTRSDGPRVGGDGMRGQVGLVKLFYDGHECYFFIDNAQTGEILYGILCCNDMLFLRIFVFLQVERNDVLQITD